jgi:hypothetical protein
MNVYLKMRWETPILLAFFVFFYWSPAVFSAPPGNFSNLLLDAIQISSDLFLGSGSAEIWEDDFATLDLFIKMRSGARFAYKKEIKDSLGNGHLNYNSARTIVDTIIQPPQIYLENDEPPFDKFLKEGTKFITQEKNINSKAKNKNEEIKLKDMPYTLTNLNEPGVLRFGIEVSGDWKYFPSALNFSSFIHCVCNDADPKKCLEGKEPALSKPADIPCDCWIEKVPRSTGSGSGSGSGSGGSGSGSGSGEEEFDEVPHHCYQITRDDHKCVKGDTVQNYIYSSALAGNKTSGSFNNEFTLTIKDRTPPHILRAQDNSEGPADLPHLFSTNDSVGDCTTGDYIKIDEIKLVDNCSGELTSRFPGQFSFPPGHSP